MKYGVAVCDFGNGPSLGRYSPSDDLIVDLEESPTRLVDRLMEFAAEDSEGVLLGSNARKADDVLVLPPIAPGARIFCVAQNYSSHAMEINGTSGPVDPVLFLKPASSFVGSGEYIEIPPVTGFLDYEAEIAVLIGSSIRRASAEVAATGVVGFTLANDGTARDLQPIEIGGRQIVDWFSAKSLDRSSSLGPAFLPLADAKDLESVEFQLTINGAEMQKDVGGQMRLSPAELVAFISHRVELLPGDIVLTGTPAGVGKARGRAMQAGDLVRVSAGKFGALVNEVVDS